MKEQDKLMKEIQSLKSQLEMAIDLFVGRGAKKHGVVIDTRDGDNVTITFHKTHPGFKQVMNHLALYGG